MSAERDRGRLISLAEAMERIEAVFVEAQARRAADRAAEERDGDDGADSSGLEAMSALAAGVIATLTRERDEARRLARELLGRYLALARLTAASPTAFGRDPAESWRSRYPWVRDAEPEAPPSEGQEDTSGDPD